MYLNIQSLPQHKTQLEWTISQWKPIIICLSETHVTEDFQNNEIDIEGYNAITTYSTSQHTGGTIIYIKNELQYTVTINESIYMNMWISGIQFSIKKHKYNILNLYHSPSSRDAEFLEKLEEILEQYVTKPGTFILVGDFNINVAKNTHYSNKIKSIIENYGLYQKIDTFTRITKESATIIDLMITNEKDIPYQIHLTPKITDHCIMTVDLMCDDKQNYYKQISRNFKNFIELNFQLDLIGTKWVPNSTDTNYLAETLVDSIISTLNKHAPIEEKTVKSRWANKQWWTPTIGLEIIERDKMYTRATITQHEQDWITYKIQRNKVVQIIRHQKEIFYHEKIDEVKHDTVEMWKTLKQLVKGDKTANKKEGIIFNNEIERDEKEIAEKFNRYFLNSLETIVTCPNQNQIDEILNNINICEYKLEKFKLIEFCELKKIVNNLKNKKSSVDGITTKILQLAFEIIGDRFLQLINNSLESGSFPRMWKTSTVIPLEKINNTIKCEQHRPINMVPIYEKLLETVVNEQIIDYIETNKLLTIKQAGFRKRNSCESALQTVIAKWKNALNEKKVIGVIFLDFRRAFETIDRKLLLLKLRKFGLGPKIINWMSEYLTDRTQITKYNNSVSSMKNSIFGVPQGTVLGPNLFLLYINDIVQYVNKCNIQLFADDTLLYLIGENVDEIVNTINEELRIIEKWLSGNSLDVNTSKTKFLIIKSKYNMIDINSHSGIYINGESIEQVRECKYLGVIIDENLTFSSHASYLTNKIAKKVNYLGRVGNVIGTWTKLLIYKTIILPHLNFCASILFLLNNTEISNMQKKQNQALRTILKCSRYTSIRYMLESTGLLSVKQTIFVNAMTVIYKIKNGLLPPHLLEECTFVEDIHNYDTRSRGNFYVTTVTTNYSQNNLFHKGLIEFNKLPVELKNSESLVSFKNKCRKYAVEYVDI